MKKILPVFISFFTLFFLSNGLMAKEYLVKKVIDGDTIQLDTGETVKYIGVEAPQINLKEGSAFFAKEAKKYRRSIKI